MDCEKPGSKRLLRYGFEAGHSPFLQLQTNLRLMMPQETARTLLILGTTLLLPILNARNKPKRLTIDRTYHFVPR
jgi:hypothetical protein